MLELRGQVVVDQEDQEDVVDQEDQVEGSIEVFSNGDLTIMYRKVRLKDGTFVSRKVYGSERILKKEK